jgi:hypothetical protein
VLQPFDHRARIDIQPSHHYTSSSLFHSTDAWLVLVLMMGPTMWTLTLKLAVSMHR